MDEARIPRPNERTFWLVVQHMREHGEQEVWGGELFTYYVASDARQRWKLWTMGATLAATVIVNRKPFGQDPQDREKVAASPEDRPTLPREPVEAPLFDRDGRPLTLAERINTEHRACALAAGRAFEHAIRCGGLLRQAKVGVKHGEWLGWLAQHFEGSPRTARAYMKLSRERDEAGIGTTLRPLNTQAITHLGSEATGREKTA